jgi:twitching motility two-component system response regulator PilG
MNKVLIVEDSAKLLLPIKMGLQNYSDQYEVLTAANGQEALNILQQGGISVLVTDLYMPKLDGLELLSYMSQNHPRVPCIVMTAFSSPDIKEAIDKLKVYHFLEKPFDLKDLVGAINDAMAQFNDGTAMDGLSVAGFLQLIQMEHKTCMVEAISPKHGRGQFYFVEGQLYDAEMQELRADQAVLAMIGWENVALRLKSLPSLDITPKVKMGIKSLILEAARLKDSLSAAGEERKEGGAALTTADLLNQAIRRAEIGDPKAAQQILTTLLRSDSKNGQGWLWYSRTATVMKTIQTAVKNAGLVAPGDQEIAREAQKIHKAVELGYQEAETVGHCLFCWTPLRQGSQVCPFCHGHQLITTQTFKAREEADPILIEQAFQRYTKIALLNKDNTLAHYHLALAHVNLGQWDEALDQLYKVRNLEPDNQSYSEELKLLLDHMANLESVSGEELAEVEEEFHEQLVKADNTSKTILVAEDSATTRKVIKMALTNEGFEVIEAKDGIEAITRFNEVLPNLVLLDIIMPGMDGYQVLAVLKKNKNFKDIPVIMLTAKDSLLDKFKGRMSGSDEYLTKPFKPEELLAKIRKYL